MITKLHLHLTPRLTLVYVLFAAVLLLFIGTFAYYRGRIGLESATVSSLSFIAVEKEAALDEWIQERQADLELIVSTPRITNYLSTLSSASAGSTEAQTVHGQLLLEFAPFAVRENGFITLFVMDPDTGQVIVSTDPDQEGTFRDDRPYFTNGQTGAYVDNPTYVLRLRKAAVTLSLPLVDTNEKLIGVLAGYLDPEQLNPIIGRSNGLQQTFDAFLVNTQNLFVTQPRLLTDSVVLLRGIHTEAVDACLKGDSGSVFAPDYRNIPAIIVYRWLPERELCLIVKVDQAEALESVQTFEAELILASIIILLVASFIGVGLARTITRPILELQHGVMRFGLGDLDIRLAENSHDELGILAHEFNHMAAIISHKESKLHDYAGQLEQRVEERTAALNRYVKRLEAVNRLDHIISSNLDIGLVYDNFVKELHALMQLDRTSIVRLNEQGDQWQVTRQWTEHQPAILPNKWFPVEGSVVEWLVTNRIALSEPEIGEHEQWPETDLLRREGIRSRILIPLIIQGQVAGLVTVASRQPSAFSEDDQTIFKTFADQLAIAIQNADLYAQVQRHAAEMEQRVVERTAQLEASNKELEAFSYSVSHDLRSPLRAIDGFSRILLRDSEAVLPADAQRKLHLIRDNAQQMGKLIDDLLAFSRLNRQPLSKQSVDMASLVRQIMEEMSSEQDNRQVEINIGDLPLCQGDPALLKQVLVNLLSNALKFTRKCEVASIEVNYQRIDGEAVYTVKDNGAGFDMAYADKLFGVFQRLHLAEDYEGTGVGLAIIKRIIHRHGGRIWVEAEVDKGATFFFTVGEKIHMSDHNYEILLVEDNPNDVELTLDALREQKISNKIHVVRDGAEALEFIFRTGAYADRLDAKPKLILLDLKLPKVSGMEVLERIRSDPDTNSIPVVMLTSSKEERDIIESYRLGVNSYIVKPVDFEQFNAAVRTIGLYWLLLNEPPKQ